MKKFEVLVSALNNDPEQLIGRMNLESDAVVINQTDHNDKRVVSFNNGYRARVFENTDRGVGASRNKALSKAEAEIVLFSDEDIVFDKGYEKKVLKAFSENADADIILFNIEVDERRRTYWIDRKTKVGRFNSGRYPAYSIAARASKLKAAGVKYSLLFGGGAKYSNGEDSLFLKDCLNAGLNMLATPLVLGEEIPRPSTWFNGYNDKIFYDRGVLYHFLYGKWAKLWGFRWVYKMQHDYAEKYPYKKAKDMLFLGIKEGTDGNREFDENGNMK